MELSRNNSARQRAIAKALAAGKSLGGLLAGFTAAAFAGCGGGTQGGPVGKYPAAPEQRPNAAREKQETVAVDGYLAPEPAPESARKKPNAGNENRGNYVTLGAVAPPPLPPTSGYYRVKPGDTLSKIARERGVTVSELKRLNGFDDRRAGNITPNEIIKVPTPKPNATNEKISQRPKGAMPPRGK